MRPYMALEGVVKVTSPEEITGHNARKVALRSSLCGYCRIRDLSPDPESVRHFLTVLRGGEEMPTRSEVLGNRAIRGENALGVPWGFKALHALLALARRLMGVLGTVV